MLALLLFTAFGFLPGLALASDWIPPLSPSDVPPLLEKLQSSDPTVRAKAAMDISRVEPLESAVAALPILLKLMNDPDSEVRRSAAAALGFSWGAGDGLGIRHPSPDIARAFVRALDDPDERVRWYSVRGLSRIVSKLADPGPFIPELRENLKSQDPDIRGERSGIGFSRSRGKGFGS